ncbi:uncharacterized protein LOC130635463 [Hydractinia symbiolongicarpus]|uniref:uncharacterized protein LOC130635463 n=1 Tax=Hydractinia symbiolongicarpus TaxID=13093 RepID=UPI002550B55E|nr:uncharacterized protein LOC130635463 [Hydractinia symbiolongicarpus]
MNFKQVIKLVLVSVCSGMILRLPDCGKLDAAWTKFYCGKKLKGSRHSITSDATFQDCAIKCVLYPKCKSISINEDERLCMLHHSRYSESGVTLETAKGWRHVETDNKMKNLGLYCEKHKPCQYGQCEDTCDARQYKCKYKAKDWKLQATNICFGTKNDQFGKFKITHNGKLAALKLKHMRGLVSCNPKKALTRWGCGWENPKNIFIVITNSEDQIIMPEGKKKEHNKIPGFNGNSSFITLDKQVKAGEELRIWYSQDLRNFSEENNNGSSCADIYAVFFD